GPIGKEAGLKRGSTRRGGAHARSVGMRGPVREEHRVVAGRNVALAGGAPARGGGGGPGHDPKGRPPHHHPPSPASRPCPHPVRPASGPCPASAAPRFETRRHVSPTAL